ncbi:MAG: hypothetical protein AB7O56_02245 [Bauldia sp.]
MNDPRKPPYPEDEGPPREEEIDEAAEESFPASDPPAFVPTHPGKPPRKGERD